MEFSKINAENWVEAGGPTSLPLAVGMNTIGKPVVPGNITEFVGMSGLGGSPRSLVGPFYQNHQFNVAVHEKVLYVLEFASGVAVGGASTAKQIHL